MSVGFIVGGKNGKKKVMAEILTRMNADLEALKQASFRDPAPAHSPSAFDPSTNFIQPESRIPPTSYIPPPTESPDYQEPAGQSSYTHASQDTPVASALGTRVCNACGARLYMVDGKDPTFCTSCGNPVN
jgi:hypothetical protein